MKKVTKKDLEKLIKEELSNVANGINEVEYDDYEDDGPLGFEELGRRLQKIVTQLEDLSKRAPTQQEAEGLLNAAGAVGDLMDDVKKKVVKRKVDPASIEKAKATRKANQTPDPEALDWAKYVLGSRGIK